MFLNLKKHLGVRLTQTWVWWKHRCPLSNLVPHCTYHVSSKTEWRGKRKWVGLFIARETDKEAQIPSLFQRGQPGTLAPGSSKRRQALVWRQFFMEGACILVVLVFNIKRFLHAIWNHVRILDFISFPSHAFFKVIIYKHIASMERNTGVNPNHAPVKWAKSKGSS